MAKLKNKTKKQCTNCFKTNHIVFNFAYLTYKEYFDDEEKTILVDRMLELSSVPYTTLGSWGKQKGFEDVPVKIKKDIPTKFQSEIEKFDGKFSIIRLRDLLSPLIEVGASRSIVPTD